MLVVLYCIISYCTAVFQFDLIVTIDSSSPLGVLVQDKLFDPETLCSRGGNDLYCIELCCIYVSYITL